MHVTGDRTAEHGLATVGFDDEGVAAQSWDLIRDGILVGYQLDRRMAAWKGFGRSNGCAFADSPEHVPVQRMANVSLQPAPGGPTHRGADRPGRRRHLRRRRQELVDRHAALQLPVHRAALLPDPRTAGWPGQLRDVAYQGTTTEFWGSMEAVGGASTYVLGGAFNCGKAQPGQVAAGEPRLPVGPVPRGADPQHRRRRRAGDAPPRRRSSGPWPLSKADGCVVIADESSNANLRWANNTLTTNGVTRGSPADRDRHHRRRDGDGRRCRVAQRGHGRIARGRWSRRPRTRPAAHAGRGRPAAGRRRRRRSPDWDAAAGRDLDRRVRRLRARPRRGLRAGRQPRTGCSSATPSTRCGRPTWPRRPACGSATTSRPATSSSTPSRPTTPARPGSGSPTADFADVDVAALDAELAERLGWAARRVDLPAGPLRDVLPPSAVADLMIYLYWSAGARDAHDGRTRVQPPGGGTRVGERLDRVPVTLAQRPGRRRPGSARRSSSPTRRVRRSRCSTTGCRSSRPRGSSDGRADLAGADPVLGRSSPGCRSRRAIDNLIMEGRRRAGRSTRWWPATDRGLLLTCLWYIREVDPQTLLLTGLTRDGVYLVEGGEVVGAVNNFRFNESPVDLLAGSPRSAPPSGPCRGSGATTSPGRPCRRCGSPTSTCRR